MTRRQFALAGLVGALTVASMAAIRASYLRPKPGAARLPPPKDQLLAAPPPPKLSNMTLRFTDVQTTSGVRFIYYGNPGPKHYMTEQNGGGIALLDFDGDDRLDLFFTNGSDFDQPAVAGRDSNRLFHAVGPWSYRDVTDASGLSACGFGTGCAAGDYDNDGFIDLFEAAYGPNRLWHNNGDGTFSDVTKAAGIDGARWSTSAIFADLDGDGDSDLYVVNYVDYSPHDPPCFRPSDRGPVRVSCDPFSKSAQTDLLYRNEGDGRFEEVGALAGVEVPNGKGLAVAAVDLDEDGRLDLYVANDTTSNFFFRNLGEMRFEEIALIRGVAVGADGRAEASMGIGCADYNGDGHLDLYVTNFQNEVNDLYQNEGEGHFRAVNAEKGLDLLSRSVLGFGTALADFDLDHWPDLFVANGHIWDLSQDGVANEYEMRPTLARNQGGERFTAAAEMAGEYFRRRWLGRSVAVGDLDNDGDPDLIVGHLRDPAALLRNDSFRAGKSLRLRIIGTHSARQPLGIRVETVIDARRWIQWVPAGGSFQASSDGRLLVPLGKRETIDELVVHWPGGTKEVWRDLRARAALDLIEGTGDNEPRVAEP